MQRTRSREERKAEQQELQKQASSEEAEAATEETDDILDKIDEILEEEERRSYKAKLRSLSFWSKGRKRDVNPCTDVVYVSEDTAARLIAGGAQVYDGPPCVGC